MLIFVIFGGMGVSRLWEILLTMAVSKNISDLSGLVLAIDASVWIMKLSYTYGDSLPEQIRSIMNRILLFKRNNIRPIFVFDGSPPELKRQTLEGRRGRKRELNDVEIRKKVQIEVLKKVQSRESNKDAQYKRQMEEKQKQIDQTFRQLIQLEQPVKNIDMEEKIRMQHDILDEQYKIYCQIDPNILQKYLTAAQFHTQEVEEKQSILREIKQTDLHNLVKFYHTMSEQEQNIYEMELIQKKSRIRELQDKLYRKVFTKKIQNGYEIIEGIYDGKKVIQRRKVKDANDEGWFRGRGKRTNDFKQIFGHQGKKQQEEGQKGQDEENHFLSRIFNPEKYQNQQQSQTSSSSRSTFEHISQRMSDQRKSYQLNKKKPSQQARLPKDSLLRAFEAQNSSDERANQEEKDNDFDEYNDLLRNNPPPEKQQQNQPQQDDKSNPDHFPDFIAMEKLETLCTTNANYQLKNILDILGVTYIEAPSEAEAQCAALQLMGLVDGVVTEDSDAFLFGAKNVYRGVFQQNIKHYSMNNIVRKLGLTREKLILFAMLLGSDYTDGVKGIGIVNAMQILKVHSSLESLRKFTDWARTADALQQHPQFRTESLLAQCTNEDQRQFYELHRKFKNYWHVAPDFPKATIFEAYANPKVLEFELAKKVLNEKKSLQTEIFSNLMRDTFSMISTQIDLNIRILNKEFTRQQQPTIDSYLQGGQFARINSKRLQKAIL